MNGEQKKKKIELKKKTDNYILLDDVCHWQFSEVHTRNKMDFPRKLFVKSCQNPIELNWLNVQINM